MVNYRERLKLQELAEEADCGNGIKVAVIDTGIPDIDGVPVSLAENLTVESKADSGHATFIGSMLFSNGPVICGICPKATPCFCKVFSGGAAKPETVARAIDHAADLWNVDIINLSLGFVGPECHKSIKKACESALARGVSIVSAAGNTGGTKTFWPAALPGVICVGSSDGKGKDAFSNSGKVDVVAPGADMPGLDTSGALVYRSGTSFSAATITGLLALLLARRRRRGDSSATAKVAEQELFAMCVDLKRQNSNYSPCVAICGQKDGMDEETGYGFPFPNLIDKSFLHKPALSIKSIFAIIKTTIRRIIASLIHQGG